MKKFLLALPVFLIFLLHGCDCFDCVTNTFSVNPGMLLIPVDFTDDPNTPEVVEQNPVSAPGEVLVVCSGSWSSSISKPEWIHVSLASASTIGLHKIIVTLTKAFYDANPDWFTAPQHTYAGTITYTAATGAIETVGVYAESTNIDHYLTATPDDYLFLENVSGTWMGDIQVSSNLQWGGAPDYTYFTLDKRDGTGDATVGVRFVPTDNLRYTSYPTLENKRYIASPILFKALNETYFLQDGLTLLVPLIFNVSDEDDGDNLLEISDMNGVASANLLVESNVFWEIAVKGPFQLDPDLKTYGGGNQTLVVSRKASVSNAALKVISDNNDGMIPGTITVTGDHGVPILINVEMPFDSTAIVSSAPIFFVTPTFIPLTGMDGHSNTLGNNVTVYAETDLPAQTVSWSATTEANFIALDMNGQAGVPGTVGVPVEKSGNASVYVTFVPNATGTYTYANSGPGVQNDCFEAKIIFTPRVIDADNGIIAQEVTVRTPVIFSVAPTSILLEEAVLGDRNFHNNVTVNSNIAWSVVANSPYLILSGATGGVSATNLTTTVTLDLNYTGTTQTDPGTGLGAGFVKYRADNGAEITVTVLFTQIPTINARWMAIPSDKDLNESLQLTINPSTGNLEGTVKITAVGDWMVQSYPDYMTVTIPSQYSDGGNKGKEGQNIPVLISINPSQIPAGTTFGTIEWKHTNIPGQLGRRYTTITW